MGEWDRILKGGREDMGTHNRQHAWAVFSLLIVGLFTAPSFGQESPFRTGRYVLDSEKSSIVQTGGFAGVHWTYTLSGQFCLIVDTVTESAWFQQVEVTAVDNSEPARIFDPNELFNLGDLVGRIGDKGNIEFTGQSPDGSSVRLILTWEDAAPHLIGETTPPPNTADFFAFSLDATAQLKYDGGTGEPNRPYQIATAEQMNTIGTDPNNWDKHFQLTADIDLAAYRGTEFNLIGTYNSSTRNPSGRGGFCGGFDGNGHTISNFTWCSDDMGEIGLFRRLPAADAQIKNLCLIDPNIDGGTGSYVGALVGYVSKGAIVNCHITNATIRGGGSVGGLAGGNDGSITNCSVMGIVVGDYAGGLVGSGNGAIRCCYSTCDVSGETNLGGLIGYNTGIVSYSYATGDITGQNKIGGLVGHNRFRAIIMTCLATGHVTGTEDVGGLTGSNDGLSVGGPGTIVASFWDIENSGQQENTRAIGLTHAQMQDPNVFIAAGWDFFGPSDGPCDIWTMDSNTSHPILWWQLPETDWPALPIFDGGDGTPEAPYLISSAEQWNSISCNPRLTTACLQLTDDIDLGQTDLRKIGDKSMPFSGVFDGNGFTVSNPTYGPSADDDTGLFGHVANPDAAIRNLNVVDPNIDAGRGYYIGALVGYLEEGTINNCYVDGGIVAGERSVGGLIGYSSSSIVHCHATTKVDGVSYIGGLVGDNDGGTIANCSAHSVVTASYDAGGLVGQNERGSIISCYAASDTGNHSSVGGLVGRGFLGSTANCYAMGTTRGQTVGGLIGYDYGSSITNCFAATYIISETPANSSGLIGTSHSPGDIIASFWDIETSGQTTSPIGIGLTTAQMQTAETYLQAGWDFVDETENGTDDLWWILESQDYPRLWWEIGNPNNQ